ncbi:MAG: ABC transporter permease subunit [Gammaproteobacteria bacterium]
MQYSINNRLNYLSSPAFIKLVLSLVVVLFSIYLVGQSDGKTLFPTAISDPFTFSMWIDDGESWLKQNYRWLTRMIASEIRDVLYVVEDFLMLSPWLFIMALLVLISLAIGGLRLALLAIFSCLFWGGVDLWDSTMQTFALMGISVFLSVLIGLFVGVMCSQNNRLEAIVRPILDTMQTMPSFVYLIPAVFFFGIGGPPAIFATMIYALPPVIRLTNLGIRQVSAESIEVARSFGSSRLQMLFKVQLPLALPSILMGINQTIMMALGLVVLATFIGAEGLGSEVWGAITRLKVGWSLEAGSCIVLMAIIFDRISIALGDTELKLKPSQGQRFYLLPQQWDRNPVAIFIETIIGMAWQSIAFLFTLFTKVFAWIAYKIVATFNQSRATILMDRINGNVFLIGSIVILLSIRLFDVYVVEIGSFPEILQFSIREPVDKAVAWLVVSPTFIAFTKGLRAVVYLYLLHPLDIYLTHLPWYFVFTAFGLIGLISLGLRFALTTVALLFFIGACGLWISAMLTLSSVMVSVLLCVIIGLPIGIACANFPRLNMVLKPILDSMQTMPSFVYLIPVLMFFGGNIVSAVIATVIYALPPVIRMTTLGITQIPEAYTEVSQMFGSTRLQRLLKVQLPMALPSIMMGINQGVMMGLAMQVITPMIGGGGLGRDVFYSLSLSNTGAGLAAGTGIVLLAIILDRLSQAWTKKQREALGV